MKKYWYEVVVCAKNGDVIKESKIKSSCPEGAVYEFCVKNHEYSDYFGSEFVIDRDYKIDAFIC